MNRFGRFLEALCESRQREAERVVRRYSHIAAQAEAYHRRRAADEAAAEQAAIARAASRLVARSAT
jgi:molecular chaperone GrpE (heat shock protein)